MAAKEKSSSFRSVAQLLESSDGLASLDDYKQINSFSRKLNFFSRFSGNRTMLKKLVQHFSLGILSVTRADDCEKLQFITGTLANVAIDFNCRDCLLSNTQVLENIEKLLDSTTVSTSILSRIARLIANLARVESAAEDMFSTNIVFSLLKHAGDSAHASNFDCTECIVRAVRILTAGRSHLLSMMLNHGGVSTVCRNFSPQSQPASLQSEILKTLKALCVTHCSMELAGQIKDSGILASLVDVARVSSSTDNVSSDAHMALKVICEVVQFSITRGILGCTGCVELFFTVINNAKEQYSAVEISKSISGICYLSRECLTRLKMREQGFLPQLVSLLSDQKHKRQLNMIVTSLLCFSNDEPGLIIMARQGNLLRNLFDLLDSEELDYFSDSKCSDKCKDKEKHMMQMRPDLFSLDFGTPIEYSRTSILQRANSTSSHSPYQSSGLAGGVGDMSPPWSNMACSPNSNASGAASRFVLTSPTRVSGGMGGSRQWLPFSQSPFLELSPHHFMMSPPTTYSASSPYSYEFSNVTTHSSTVEQEELFSDEEDDEEQAGAETTEVGKDVSECEVVSSTMPQPPVEESVDKTSFDSGLGESTMSHSPLCTERAISRDILSSAPSAETKCCDVCKKRKRQQSIPSDIEPSSKREKSASTKERKIVESKSKKGEQAFAIKKESSDSKRSLTCLESNILQLLTKLSMVQETAFMLCRSSYVESMLSFYSKLSSPNAQLQRILERLIENVAFFMQLIRNNFAVHLHRRFKALKSDQKDEPIYDLIVNMQNLLESNSENKYNYSELYTALSNSPIEMQFSVAVSLPFILKKPEAQKVFFVDHFALDLLVNSFSKTQYLSDQDLENAVLALRQVLVLVRKELIEQAEASELSSESVASQKCDDTETVEDISAARDEVELCFDDSESAKFSRQFLCERSDVLKVMLANDSSFKERNQKSIELKNVKMADFQTAVYLAQNKDTKEIIQLPVAHKTQQKSDTESDNSKTGFDAFGVLNVFEMYNLLTACNCPENVAASFLKLMQSCQISETEDVFENFVSKTAQMPSMSMTLLNLVCIIVFQQLFMSEKFVSESKAVIYMKQLLNIPQFSTLLLECFSEKVVNFYFLK
ncbi:uncharacterized protein LOC142335887 [Convolutriloba macropyga]|uniref:uncharacterized protein LOC142335887 n=1 Tax=Convolutriloba macropyga TaxID=536237 RepID=UPI003F525688